MIDPRGLSLQEWCEFTTEGLSSYGPVPILRDPEDWQEWAELVVSVPTIATLNPPDPRHFSDWKEWAERFVQVVPY